MCRVGILVLVILTVITIIASHKIDAAMYVPPQDRDIQGLPTWEQEYIRQIHSMFNAYRSDILGGRLVIETNALIDTKYKTWKRNADFINSMLALPKGMNEAGR